MRELVSVLIPAYNAEEWLTPAVRSVLGQTWPHIEVIIVDDGSKDGTLAVAKRLEGKSIKVVSQENAGSTAARNTAFQHAQGSFIQWLDADDLLHPEKIARQMKVAQEINDPRVVLSGPFGTFFYRHERALFERNQLWRDLTPVDYFLTRFRHDVWFQTGAWLVSRELSEATGEWTDAGSPDDDGEYFARVVARSAGVRFVEGATAYYRIGNFGSVNNGRSNRALTALFGSKVKCIRYLLALEDSERTRQASVIFLQHLMRFFCPNRPDIVARARQLANELGGDVRQPALKWKYRPAEWLFGYGVAADLSRALPRLRMSAMRRWDRVLFNWSQA